MAVIISKTLKSLVALVVLGCYTYMLFEIVIG